MLHHIPIIIFPPPPDLLWWPSFLSSPWAVYAAWAIGFYALIRLIWYACERACGWIERTAQEGIDAISDYDCFWTEQPRVIHGADHAARVRRFAAWRRAQ